MSKKKKNKQYTYFLIYKICELDLGDNGYLINFDKKINTSLAMVESEVYFEP